jgi:hypothetical protein
MKTTEWLLTTQSPRHDTDQVHGMIANYMMSTNSWLDEAYGMIGNKKKVHEIIAD